MDRWNRSSSSIISRFDIVTRNSICLYPLDRFGPRCSLLHTACRSNPCQHHGQCLPNDERHWTCLCPLGYSGQRCEHRQTRLEIDFDRRVAIPSALLVHFVTLEDDREPSRVSLMKKVTWAQSSLTVFTSSRFHLAFVQIFDQFYSIVLREQLISSARMSVKVRPSSRCRSLSELFNETFVQRHLLRRIKFYPIPCREQRDLVCFSDSIHLCLCDRFRRAYCYEFDHRVNRTCRRDDICVNQGQCFQDDSHCPTSFQCICPKCFYGSRCQYSSQGSILSLDTIIGYQIQVDVPIHQQPVIIRTVTSVTIVLFILGFLSNSLSCLTFRGKTTCDVGCGIYLFALSVVSLLALSLFASKFFIFLLSQINAEDNSLFQRIHCILTDFLLRVLLTIGD